MSKSREILMSLRNLLIVLIVVGLTVCSVEYILEKKDDKSALEKSNYTTQQQVDLTAMGYQKSTREELNSVYYLKDFFSSYGIDYTPSSSYYPLINNVKSYNEYDENTKNIVVFGDSFVWGTSSLNRNELFWRLVETELRSKGYNCRIYSVGFAGANAYEELNWLTKTNLVNDLNPDLVIFGYVFNDLNTLTFAQELSNAEYLDPEGDIPFNSFFKNHLPYIHKSLCSYAISNMMYNDKSSAHITCSRILSNNGIPICVAKGEVYEEYKNKFVKPLDDYAKKADFPIAIMTLSTSMSYPIQKALFKPLNELYKNSNVSFYDSLKAFHYGFSSKKHSDNYAVNPADNHPGSSLNRFYADYIIDFIRKDYPDVLGECQNKDLNNHDIHINEWMPGKLNLTEVVSEKDYATYSIDYPSYNKTYHWGTFEFNSYFLNYPLGKDYVKLSFSHPLDIQKIEITGDNVEKIDLYYTRINKNLNYDDHKILPFGEKSSDVEVWTDSTSDLVTSLCIHADCIKNDGSKLQIKISKTES